MGPKQKNQVFKHISPPGLAAPIHLAIFPYTWLPSDTRDYLPFCCCGVFVCVKLRYCGSNDQTVMCSHLTNAALLCSWEKHFAMIFSARQNSTNSKFIENIIPSSSS